MVKRPENIVFLVGGVIIFMLINFDPSFGQVFSAMLLLAAMMFTTDKTKTFFIEKPGVNRLKSMAIALGAYITFIISSYLVLGALKVAGMQTVEDAFTNYSLYLASLYSQYAPALADSVFWLIIGFGIVIAFTETYYFAVLYEFLGDYLKINWRRKGIKTILLAIAVGIIFALFHLTSKGLANDAALIMTGIFGLISILLILYTGQMLEAILLHIITNTTAVLTNAGVTILSPLVIGVGIAVVLFFIITKLPKRAFKIVGG